MKNFLVSLALIAIVVVLFSQFVPRSARVSMPMETATIQPYQQEAVPWKDREKIILEFPNKKITVEAVTTDASITQGLSGRSEIGSDGMLFVFGERHIPRFWMKEMKFALDFVWIDGDKIIEITKQVPPPKEGQSLSQLPLYSPQQSITQVLEVPAGKADEWGIAVGDRVTFSR